MGVKTIIFIEFFLFNTFEKYCELDHRTVVIRFFYVDYDILPTIWIIPDKE